MRVRPEDMKEMMVKFPKKRWFFNLSDNCLRQRQEAFRMVCYDMQSVCIVLHNLLFVVYLNLYLYLSMWCVMYSVAVCKTLQLLGKMSCFYLLYCILCSTWQICWRWILYLRKWICSYMCRRTFGSLSITPRVLIIVLPAEETTAFLLDIG